MGWLTDIVNAIKGVPAAAETIGSDVGKGVASVGDVVLGREGGKTTDPAAIAAKGKTKPKTPTTTKGSKTGTTTLDEKIANTPIYRVGQLLVQQYQGQIKTSPEAKLLTGQVDQNAVGQASDTGLALLGLSPQSTAGQWLASQSQAEQAAATPLDNALAQYQQIYEQSGQGVASALTQMAQANALNVATGPGQSWLNELVTKLGYSAGYQGVTTPQANATIPPALAQALYSAATASQTIGTKTAKKQSAIPTGVSAAGVVPTFSPATGTAGSAGG